MPLSPGDKFGPYEIVSKLGAGGMGEVYRARDGGLNRAVAIKAPPSALANERTFTAAVSLVRRLSGPQLPACS
jgi:serine/threonine protein kinase